MLYSCILVEVFEARQWKSDPPIEVAEHSQTNKNCQMKGAIVPQMVLDGQLGHQTVPLITLIHPIYIGFHGSRTNGIRYGRSGPKRARSISSRVAKIAHIGP